MSRLTRILHDKTDLVSNDVQLAFRCLLTAPIYNSILVVRLLRDTVLVVCVGKYELI